MLDLLTRAQNKFPDRAGFKVTQSLIDDVKSDLRDARTSPVRVAQRYGVPVSFVRFVTNELPSPDTVYKQHSTDGWGREGLRDFIVARKFAYSGWNEEDQERINAVREQYDAGTHELCSGRDGDFIILYAIPRKKQVKRFYPYFQELELDDDE